MHSLPENCFKKMKILVNSCVRKMDGIGVRRRIKFYRAWMKIGEGEREREIGREGEGSGEA